MPKIDLSNVKEATRRNGYVLEPGAYVLVITEADHDATNKRVFFEWDVAEGEHAGMYKDANWPPKDVMSYQESAREMLKLKLNVLTDDNPGFNADKAFQEDDWKAFEGKKFGAVIRERLYTKRNGEDGKAVEIDWWYRTSEVPELAAQFEEDPDSLPKPRDTRKKTAPAPAPVTSATAEVYDEDIPF